MRLAGVCATDLQILRGYAEFSGILGHEFVGRVDSADPLVPGQRVVADINLSCGRCTACTSGDGHHCAARRVIGIRGAQGAFADQLVLPRTALIPVPDELSDEQAVFAEPLAASLHVLDAIPPEASEVTVLGDGKLGLLIALALAGSQRQVRLVGRHQAKLDTVAAHPNIEATLESQVAADPTWRASAAAVVEATGSASGVARALWLARPRASVILKTTLAGPVAIDLSAVVVHELRLIGSRCGDMRAALAALASGAVDPRPLIAARFPLSQGEQALARAASPGVLKVLLDMSQDPPCTTETDPSRPS